jgi:hypothetical protein
MRVWRNPSALAYVSVLLHRCLCYGVSPRWRPHNSMIISQSTRAVLTRGDCSSRWVDRTASTSMTSDHVNFLEQSGYDTSSQLQAPHPIRNLHVQLPLLCPPTIRPVTVDAPKGTVLAQCFNPPEPTAVHQSAHTLGHGSHAFCMVLRAPAPKHLLGALAHLPALALQAPHAFLPPLQQNDTPCQETA